MMQLLKYMWVLLLERMAKQMRREKAGGRERREGGTWRGAGLRQGEGALL